MVKIVAIVAFLIFSLEVTPFYSMLVLGSGNTLKYLSLSVLCFFLTLRARKQTINTTIILLLLIAVNEIILNFLHGQVSLNGSRILISVMIYSLLISDKESIEQFLEILRKFYSFTVYGFILTFALAIIFGEAILHSPLPIVDDTIFNKVSYTGALKIESIFIFNFNIQAAPEFNFLRLSFLPSGLSSEPHAFFSYVLVSTVILKITGYLSRGSAIASLITMFICVSYSNILALLLAGFVILILFIIQRFGFKSLQNFIAISIISFTLFFINKYLSIENIFIVASTFDRSLSQSFAIVVRMFSMDFGTYSLEDIPTFQNGYEIFPISPTSVALFLAFMIHLTGKLSLSLGWLRSFILVYLLFYTGKSLGVTIFLPYSIISILLLTNRKI